MTPPCIKPIVFVLLFLLQKEIAVDNYPQDFGLLLDIVGVLVLAKFQTPSTLLNTKGQEARGIGWENNNKYKVYRGVTITAYIIIGIGFLLQTNIVNQWIRQ